jgi:hypothetical protein
MSTDREKGDDTPRLLATPIATTPMTTIRIRIPFPCSTVQGKTIHADDDDDNDVQRHMCVVHGASHFLYTARGVALRSMQCTMQAYKGKKTLDVTWRSHPQQDVVRHGRCVIHKKKK